MGKFEVIRTGTFGGNRRGVAAHMWSVKHRRLKDQGRATGARSLRSYEHVAVPPGYEQPRKRFSVGDESIER